MGISINVNAKQDYSYLFSNMSSGSSSSFGNLNFLSDYASIKNGSYGKLMKAYYTKDSAKTTSSATENKTTDTEKRSTSTAADSAKVLSNIEKRADILKDSADELLKKDKDAVLNGTDTDKIGKAVSSFVNDYNALLDNLNKSESKALQNRTTTLTNLTIANSKKLAEVGITVNDDKSLKLDTETLKKADTSKLKSLFQTSGSYGYQVSAQASLTDYTAEKESTKANTYNQYGSYSNNYSTGNILSALF